MAGGDSLAGAGAEQQPGPVVEGNTASISTTASEAAEAEATTVALSGGGKKAEAEDGEVKANATIPPSGGDKGDAADVEALVAEMGRLSLRLLEEHGVACAVLGKDGGVVALPLPATTTASEQTGQKGPTASSSSSSSSSSPPETEAADGDGGGGAAAVADARTMVELAGGLVGHKQADVVLKIEGGAVQYLHASSGKSNDGRGMHMARSSFIPPAAHLTHAHKHNRGPVPPLPLLRRPLRAPLREAQSRVVELHLPCPAMLAPTLYHLYTGEAPEPLRHGGAESVEPKELFGLLANAKYLLCERLQEQCADFLARAIKALTHIGKLLVIR